MKKLVSLSLILLFFVSFTFSLETSVSDTESSIPQSPSEHIPKKSQIGKLKILILFVKFPDVINETNYTEIMNNQVEEMKLYWHNVSYGKLDLEVSSTSSYVELPGNSSHYGKDFDYDGDGNINVDPNTFRCGNPWWKLCTGSKPVNSLIEDTLKIYDSKVDYTQYDHFIIVSAGQPQHTSRNIDDLWPKCVCFMGSDRSYTYETEDGIIDSTKQGIVLVTENGHIGTFIHELGHTFGLPDLYDYDRNLQFVYTWSVMAAGGYLPEGQGTNPSHPTSAEKVWLGWLNPLVVNSGEKKIVTIQYPMSTGNGFGTYAVKLPYPPDSIVIGDPKDHYFMLELRQKTLRDYYLPNEGVLVTLIDETKDGGEGIIRVIDGYDGDGLNNAALKTGWYGRLIIPLNTVSNEIGDLIGIHVISIGGDGAVIEIHHGLPDLKIENITVVDEIKEGDDINFQITVENTKKWESYPAFVELHVDGYLINTVSTSTIQGFESQVLTIGPWIATPGDHIVTVKVDPGNDLVHFSGTNSGKIMESNEKNNKKDLFFNVNEFAPVIKTITQTSNVTITQTSNVTITQISKEILTKVSEIEVIQYVTKTDSITKTNLIIKTEFVTSTFTSTISMTENNDYNISTFTVVLMISSILIGFLLSKFLKPKIKKSIIQ